MLIMPSLTDVAPKAMWDGLEILGQGYANNNNNDNNYDASSIFYRAVTKFSPTHNKPT